MLRVEIFLQPSGSIVRNKRDFWQICFWLLDGVEVRTVKFFCMHTSYYGIRIFRKAGSSSLVDSQLLHRKNDISDVRITQWAHNPSECFSSFINALDPVGLSLKFRDPGLSCFGKDFRVLYFSETPKTYLQNCPKKPKHFLWIRSKQLNMNILFYIADTLSTEVWEPSSQQYQLAKFHIATIKLKLWHIGNYQPCLTDESLHQVAHHGKRRGDPRYSMLSSIFKSERTVPWKLRFG